MASGGTRLVHSREMKVIERYSQLGPEGKDLAMLLLGRGRLGHFDVHGRAGTAPPQAQRCSPQQKSRRRSDRTLPALACPKQH